MHIKLLFRLLPGLYNLKTIIILGIVMAFIYGIRKYKKMWHEHRVHSILKLE